MTSARGRRGIAVVIAAVALAGACATEKRGPTRPDGERATHFGADGLSDLDRDGGIYDALDPEERAALERSGMSGAEASKAAADDDGSLPQEESTSDNVGKAVMSALVVAVTAAAAAAPYLLF